MTAMSAKQLSRIDTGTQATHSPQTGVARPERRPSEGREEPAALDFHIRPFKAAWWLPGTHGQTLGARWLRRRIRISLRRERIETLDGDFIDLDFAQPPSSDGVRNLPLVLILHGLEGCSGSGYVSTACQTLAASGLRAVAMNFRSRSGEPNRRPDSYHAGRSDDVAFVLDELRRTHPQAPLGAIGFSLGGNVLLKYLGERGAAARDRLRAAVAVSVPFDLAASAQAMERGFGALYARHFLRSMRRTVQDKAVRFPGAFDSKRIADARTIREFDDAVTAPIHGFESVAHYYAEASSAGYLEGVRVPTLLLQSRDDPLVPYHELSGIRQNPWLVDGSTERGGHVGFVAGALPWNATFWAEREASRFLKAQLESCGTGGRQVGAEKWK